MKYGYIYKISYNGLNYYGSSKDKYRFNKHKNDFKCWKNGKSNYVSSYELFLEAEKNNELPTFEVLGCFYKYFCNECIRKEEQKWIDVNECINICNSFGFDRKKWLKEQYERTKYKRKEYYELNKEKIIKRQVENNKKNNIKRKEYMKKYSKEYYKKKITNAHIQL